mmetsp:Transcript_41928/g.42506  ORF Transcript_41928/g.42506 Transcript_41928/m.42506 type:complete len:86 (+) Transcript_41928:92-349(+)
MAPQELLGVCSMLGTIDSNYKDPMGGAESPTVGAGDEIGGLNPRDSWGWETETEGPTLGDDRYDQRSQEKHAIQTKAPRVHHLIT